MSESSDDGRLAERISDRPIFECCQGRGYHLLLCKNNPSRDENLRQMALRDGIWAGFEEAERDSATGYLNIYPDAVTPSLLAAEVGYLFEVNGSLYRVAGITPGEDGARSFQLEPYDAG